MALNNVNRFQALLWKNCIVEWSDKSALIETNIWAFILPLALIPLRIIIPIFSTDERIFNETVSIDNLDLFKNTPFAPNPTNTVQLHLAYSPNTNPVFEEIVKAAATSLGLEYSGYANSRSLQTALKKQNYLTGVEFDASLPKRYPQQLSYKLRFPNRLRKYDSDWHTDRHFLFPYEGTNRNDIDGGSPVGYLREGFLPVQNAISTAFITQVAKDKAPTLPKIDMQRYPRTATSTALMMTHVHNYLGLVFVISFQTTFIFMVKFVMEEKEKQLKEVMKIMGLQSWVQWLGWSVTSLMTMTICTIFITAILTIEWKKDIVYITYASTSLIIFFFLVYTMANLTMLFLGTAFLSKSTTAVIVLEIFCYITLIPFFPLLLKYNQISLGLKLVLCLLPNVAMCTGVRTIFIKERSGEGWYWSNMFMKASADDSLSLGLIIVMMLVSCVIYMVLCLYVEQIFPREFGVPQKWNFPFKKCFWTGEHEYEDMNPIIRRVNRDAFEAEPLNAKIGLQAINLSKIFGKHIAVNNVSLNMYEDEVTVLLGHNGAGKTTMISMLTGMIPSTSGTAIINGYDIRTNLAAARMSMSICPQHNILFDELTVKQHLIFYGSLKGLTGDALKTEVETYIKKVDLGDKANVKVSELSGGMKRKLSVCAAFCGGPKVVLLDEPSSGLDPAARRHLWDLIISEKQGRTILLTTHFMDEAEVLGDRVAILSDGQLKCFGTPFFLKKKFGSGYNLICIKKPNCDSTQVTKLLEKHIPGIQPATDIGSELSYRLPDSYTPRFKMMLQDLESNSNKLNLDGYGISITTLEDVFMKLGANQEKGDSISLKNVFLDKQDRLKGRALLCSQWRAMILKKFLFRIRNEFLLAAQILLPIACGIILWLLLNTKAIATGGTPIPLPLDLLEFPETVTVLETKPNVKDESLEAKISKNYKKIVNSIGPDHVLTETGNQNFIDYILELGRTKQKLIDNNYIAAATVDGGKITAWLNNEPLHSAPITLNMIHNAMARSLIGPSASINVANYPLPPPSVTSVSKNNFEDIDLYYIASTLIYICICLVAPMYVLFLIKERQSRAKLLQFVGGVRTITFWLSHYVNDLFTLTISTLILLIAIFCSQIDGLATLDELGFEDTYPYVNLQSFAWKYATMF